ncbi:hydroperoxide isomerase ALOXE3-like [Gouania willdenowi]|uniref:Hydroperoxide isomerase ALOXE3-like n=1 Tax=Gouania willdenowi TaxID=441366 RepID=A0A8C5HV23_GOUWI|nr:hydroperoxide isomerase ALOXE3-like [Gouania willdenowi]XP_028303947.1 hydroperoxide isomerase ALOXE3-like [Gouania willdenowi]
MAEYKLAVTTGSMTYAGTMDHIYVTLIGTEGQSERTELNNWGPDFVTGTTQTYSIKPKLSLGELLLVRLEKHSFLFLPENQWFCSKIVVTTPEGELLFPCYRWISNGELVELRGGKARKNFEDVHPKLIYSRKKDLMMRKNLYRWTITDPKIPHHLQFMHVSELPAEEQFSLTRTFEMKYSEARVAIALMFKGMLGSTEQWGKIEDMNDIFCIQKTTISEYVAKHWKDDDFFGYQFLNGTNPCAIKKCSKLPPNFPVTDEMVKPILGTGCSLDEEIEKGNIFICDYKIMDKIPTRMCGEEPLQMPASMCLFYMNPKNKLMPIAIQLNQQPSEQNPIFLPSDSETDWLLAKLFVKSAHALEFELVVHLMGTHFLAEVFTVAALRNFHPIHPLYKLLIPHFEYTLPINTLGRITLLGTEGAFEISTLGNEGSMELIRRGLSETTYSSLCLPDNISARGLESIPNYYYRDDGLKLWNIINSYVEKMMQYYYPSDGDVSKDRELQGWIQEVFTHGFLGNKHSGIPSDFTKVIDLVKFLTMVIFTVTAQHAAVNNGQFDYLSWVLNGPLLLRKPPPTTKGQSSLETILETVPNIGETARFAVLSLILSKKYSDMVVLRAHSEERFDELEPKQIELDFQAELFSLSDAIQTRNAELEIPYTYLNPTQIENSITI